MKKRGVTLIETVVAITIFLIGIIPIAQLTLNSMRQLKRASEIEEGARVASTVINYIKSRGYNNLLTTPLSGNNFSGSYYLSYDNDEGAYVVTDTNGNLTTNTGEDFETDFYGTAYNQTGSQNALFIIESLGIDLEGAVIDVVMKKANLYLSEKDASDNYIELSYTNPLTTSPSSVIFGDKGIVTDKILYGLVRVNYQSKSTTDSTQINKEYEQTFVVTPLENF